MLVFIILYLFILLLLLKFYFIIVFIFYNFDKFNAFFKNWTPYSSKIYDFPDFRHQITKYTKSSKMSQNLIFLLKIYKLYCFDNILPT